MTASLYGDLLAAGIPLDNHESDLYFLDTPESRAILAHWPDLAKLALPFWSNLETDEKWWDVPFAFLPWWEKRLLEFPGARLVGNIIEPADLKD